MKKSLLAIALGLAVMPLTFAQTTPPPATGTPAEGTAPKAKKTKKHKKAKKDTTTTSTDKKTGAVKSVAPATSANPTK
jgi:hypothetical protein